MAATTYTGTGGTLAVSNAVNGVSFQPDFVWIKNRTNAYNHREWDSVRGVGAGYLLLPNLTDAEGNASQEARGLLTALNSNGFTVGPGSTDAIGVNESGSAFVAWQWKAGGTAASNTAGSITSSVSANTTAGFSVLTYTGNSTSGATIGHGLGVKPDFMIFKYRGSTIPELPSWYVYHKSYGATQYMYLNSTAALDSSSVFLNNTEPTSTLITLGNAYATNDTSETYVAYCFAAVAGYSAFGSFGGNGTTDNTFIYTGFKPRFVMWKNATGGASSWMMMDTARNTYNVTNTQFNPNNSDAEVSASAIDCDYLSNGFKIKGTSNNFNGSGNTIIFAAFAESPFKYANAR
jgi:hypothetical protein